MLVSVFLPVSPVFLRPLPVVALLVSHCQRFNSQCMRESVWLKLGLWVRRASESMGEAQVAVALVVVRYVGEEFVVGRRGRRQTEGADAQGHVGGE